MQPKMPKSGPTIIVDCRGIVATLKPPGWEVDTSTEEQSGALYLSTFLQSQLAPQDSDSAVWAAEWCRIVADA